MSGNPGKATIAMFGTNKFVSSAYLVLTFHLQHISNFSNKLLTWHKSVKTVA